MNREEMDRQLEGLAALEDPLRRRLYFYVASRDADVSRDEAAEAAGVSRMLAGFHLDRLVEQGLLTASFRRLSGRTGPGAGRPSKLYRRSDRQLSVSLPPRQYELAARILAAAVAADEGGSSRPILQGVAREVGARLGQAARAEAGAEDDRDRRLDVALAELATQGYEPARTAGEIRLRNCPFHALVGEHRDLVCGMNLALVEGLASALELEGVTPVLDPRPGACCVALRIAERGDRQG